MKGNDAFEERLRRQPIKVMPESWRAEILEDARPAKAQAFPRAADESMRQRAGSFGFVLGALRRTAAELISPGRKAWAGLGLAWAVIILVTLAGREPDAALSAASEAPSPLARELLKEQAQLLSEFSGASEPIDAVVPDKPKAGPRSQSKSPWAAV